MSDRSNFQKLFLGEDIKVGITEKSDASADYSWKEKIELTAYSVIITKNITDKFIEEILKYKHMVILHATTTGYGGTVLEPNIPPYITQLSQLNKLVSAGFPREQVVVRVDPIIPTKKGLSVARKVIVTAALLGFTRFRISVFDCYEHVKDRFSKAGLSLPYSTFTAPQSLFDDMNKMLKQLKEEIFPKLNINPDNIVFESCAEPLLDNSLVEPTGCVSQKDADIFNITLEQDLAKPRLECLCCKNKMELFPDNARKCPYRCLYCFWK